MWERTRESSKSGRFEGEEVMGARRNEEAMSTMQGTPWEPIPGREGTQIRSRVALLEAVKAAPAVREFAGEVRVRRRPNIDNRDAEKFGI